MSEQERNVSRAGFVKPDTIWGFEEPENNLELKYAFDLAEKFKAYSKDIQVFLTTHSPAFYALKKDDDASVNVFFISQSNDACTEIKSVAQSDVEGLGEPMGLLPIITPYLSTINQMQNRVVELEKTIDNLPKKFKYVVLTEDEDTSLIRKLFELNGFDNTQTEYISYNGSGQFSTGALLLAQYIKDKTQVVKVIIHRDRDYLSDETVSGYEEAIRKKGFVPFITLGVDIESYFICERHLKECFKSLASEIPSLLDEATKAVEQESIDRLINSVLQDRSQKHSANKLRELVEIYHKNPERYRYGKFVKRRLTALIQTKLKSNPNFYQKTEGIQISLLSSLALSLWGEEQ